MSLRTRNYTSLFIYAGLVAYLSPLGGNCRLPFLSLAFYPSGMGLCDNFLRLLSSFLGKQSHLLDFALL